MDDDRVEEIIDLATKLLGEILKEALTTGPEDLEVTNETEKELPAETAWLRERAV